MNGTICCQEQQDETENHYSLQDLTAVEARPAGEPVNRARRPLQMQADPSESPLRKVEPISSYLPDLRAILLRVRGWYAFRAPPGIFVRI